MGAVNCSDMCNLILNLIKKTHIFEKLLNLLECKKMVITPFVINIYP